MDFVGLDDQHRVQTEQSKTLASDNVQCSMTGKVKILQQCSDEESFQLRIVGHLFTSLPGW